MDIRDYVWGLSLPPFEPSDIERYKDVREQLREDMTTTKGGYFLCTYFALLASMDTEIHSEDSIVSAMDMLVDYSTDPGKYLPMPYAMPEMFNISDENPYHDVRPLVYSIAPWFSTVTNLDIRRMPFGIDARGTKYLEKIENYVYKKGLLSVTFQGEGDISKLKLNGKYLKHSYQLPENMIASGQKTLEVILSEKNTDENILSASTVELKSISTEKLNVNHIVEAYGENMMEFKNLTGEITIYTKNGETVDYDTYNDDGITIIEFTGIGIYTIYL